MYVERSVRWISEIHPPYRDAIRGCSEEEIARLERANGRELPAIYRELLTRMGHEAALPRILDAGEPLRDVDLSFEAVLKASEGPGLAHCHPLHAHGPAPRLRLRPARRSNESFALK